MLGLKRFYTQSSWNWGYSVVNRLFPFNVSPSKWWINCILFIRQRVCVCSFCRCPRKFRFQFSSFFFFFFWPEILSHLKYPSSSKRYQRHRFLDSFNKGIVYACKSAQREHMNTIPCRIVLIMQYQIWPFVFFDLMYGVPCSIFVPGIKYRIVLGFMLME